MTVQDRVTHRVIRFDPNGPDGLKPMTLDSEDFHEMPQSQSVHVYFEDPELGLSAGVWETTPMQEAFGPYPGDEFIYVLNGNFDMRDTLDGSGENVSCAAGQHVIFRNGVPVSWKQHDTLKKFYITYLDPRAKTPQGLSAQGSIQVLEGEQPLTEADRLADTSSVQHEKIYFENDHGNFEVGMWDTGPMDSEMEPFPTHEFVHVLEGEVTITTADGQVETFGQSDVFFLPAGTVCKWYVPTYLRKYFAALDPTIRPGG